MLSFWIGSLLPAQRNPDEGLEVEYRVPAFHAPCAKLGLDASWVSLTHYLRSRIKMIQSLFHALVFRCRYVVENHG